MGSGNILQSGRFGAPKALKRAFRLAALAALVLGFAPRRAAAQTPACPGTITQNLTLTADIVANTSDTSPCITVGNNGLTINLGNYKIDVSSFGNAGVAISTGATNNTSIVATGGTIITAYTSGATSSTAAIQASGGSGLTISGVNILNEWNTETTLSLCQNPRSGAPVTPPNPVQEYGTGISLSNVTGATIGSNYVCFYQYGVYVQGSTIPSTGSGTISGNTLNWDAYNMSGSTNEIYSAGLVLDGSNGWTVNGNTIYQDGSASAGGTCVSPSSTSGLNTCSWALQVINGSSSNSLSSNDTEYNFIGGIYTGVDTSGNKITGNTSLNNFSYDMWDDAPSHANAWHHNTCSTEGGTLPAHTCHN
jgi:hypothetical protein